MLACMMRVARTPWACWAGVTPRQLETAARFSPRGVVLALADAAGDAAAAFVRRRAAGARGRVRRRRRGHALADGAGRGGLVEGRRLRGETDAAIASACHLCAAATA